MAEVPWESPAPSIGRQGNLEDAKATCQCFYDEYIEAPKAAHWVQRVNEGYWVFMLCHWVLNFDAFLADDTIFNNKSHY
jgi:hypothetical protein